MSRSKEAHGRVAWGDLSDTHLSPHGQALLWPRSLIKSQLLAPLHGLSFSLKRWVTVAVKYTQHLQWLTGQVRRAKWWGAAILIYMWILHLLGSLSSRKSKGGSNQANALAWWEQLLEKDVYLQREKSYSNSLAVITNLLLKKRSLSPRPQPCSTGTQKRTQLSYVVLSATRN